MWQDKLIESVFKTTYLKTCSEHQHKAMKRLYRMYTY